MPLFSEIEPVLRELAPLELAEEWDNVGLLLGRRSRSVEKVLTCLTLTPNVAAEAIDGGFEAIISHHPILFRSVQKITGDDSQGEMLLKLIAREIVVYSPHTAWDSAPAGINQQIAERLGLREITPLRPNAERPEVGTGRMGLLPNPVPFGEIAERMTRELRAEGLHTVGDLERSIGVIGIACGAAGEMLRDAIRNDCDLFLTGEVRFHTALEAETANICLAVPGHYATERHAMETLAGVLTERFPGLRVQASELETDPLSWKSVGR